MNTKQGKVVTSCGRLQPLKSQDLIFVICQGDKIIFLFSEDLSVRYPDVFWYHLNGTDTQKNVPKKVLVTLFPSIFHVKTK